MYFALLGKTPELSLLELAIVKPMINDREKSRIFFETKEDPTLFLNRLAWIIKRWKIIDEAELWSTVNWAELIWASDSKLWSHCKKSYGVKRFKLVPIEKSDEEVIESWIEVIDFDERGIGLIKWRQDIAHFAAIDFDKPVRGMQVGMMPTKLAQMLVNIAVWYTDKNPLDELTIYDPFVGFGTTSWVANWLGYHTIWSDITIPPAKQNHKRWITTKFFDSTKRITFFKHDVNDPFEQPFLKHVDAIVTEWRLGPVVNGQVVRDSALVKQNIDEIHKLYFAFLKNAQNVFKGKPIVFTIPVYLFLDRPLVEDRIQQIWNELWLHMEFIGELYKREKQLVGRRVVVVR